MWYHFNFTSGANPYICVNYKDACRNIRFWKRKGYKVEKIQEGYYLVHDND